MKNDSTAEIQNLPCPICDQKAYSWGVLQAQGLRFVPEGTSFLARNFSLRYEVLARKCENCGNVQIFAEPLQT